MKTDARQAISVWGVCAVMGERDGALGTLMRKTYPGSEEAKKTSWKPRKLPGGGDHHAKN